jgi:hypothetical protein
VHLRRSRLLCFQPHCQKGCHRGRHGGHDEQAHKPGMLALSWCYPSVNQSYLFIDSAKRSEVQMLISRVWHPTMCRHEPLRVLLPCWIYSIPYKEPHRMPLSGSQRHLQWRLSEQSMSLWQAVPQAREALDWLRRVQRAWRGPYGMRGIWRCGPRLGMYRYGPRPRELYVAFSFMSDRAVI